VSNLASTLLPIWFSLQDKTSAKFAVGHVSAVNVTLLEVIVDYIIYVGHRYCSYKNPTERCSWYAAECGTYSGVTFISSIIMPHHRYSSINSLLVPTEFRVSSVSRL